MERKIKTLNTYEPSPGVRSIGVSCTVPRLSLSVSELVKRFTLTTLKEMEAKSLLNYDFGPEVKEDPFVLLDKLDLKVSSCIDLTDVEELAKEARRQMNMYKELHEQEVAAQAAKAAEEKAEIENSAFAKRAAEYVKQNGIKIE